MKNTILSTVLLAILACSSDRSKETISFRDSAIDVLKIGSLQRLTDDSRSIYPVFASGDTIVYYQRLLLTDMADTFAYFPEQIVKPYGINIVNGQLYTLDGKLEYPSAGEIEVSGLPKRTGESTVWALRSPDSSMIAFETIPIDSQEKTHIIYLVRGDSIQRLSYGDVSCFLDRFSNTGRYLTAVYSTSPTWLLIFDLRKSLLYKIKRSNKDNEFDDYLTSFSEDDKMMLFIRSNREYSWNRDYFGDIWLLKINK